MSAMTKAQALARLREAEDWLDQAHAALLDVWGDSSGAACTPEDVREHVLCIAADIAWTEKHWDDDDAAPAAASAAEPCYTCHDLYAADALYERETRDGGRALFCAECAPPQPLHEMPRDLVEKP